MQMMSVNYLLTAARAALLYIDHEVLNIDLAILGKVSSSYCI
jgi:hypothetical protein